MYDLCKVEQDLATGEDETGGKVTTSLGLTAHILVDRKIQCVTGKGERGRGGGERGREGGREREMGGERERERERDYSSHVIFLRVYEKIRVVMLHLLLSQGEN